MNDNLNIFTEQRKRCYTHLNQLRELMKGRLEWNPNYLYMGTKHRVIPIYQGTAIKTRESEEGVYDIQFWFVCGYTNVTWHEGFTTESVY